MKKSIAILGATSHIAKGLIVNFLNEGNFVLHLYARSPEKTRSFIDSIKGSENNNNVLYQNYADFEKGSYDVVINCVGVGTANKLQGNYSKYFTVTEEYDNLVLRYLCNGHPDTMYISLSSGAVYGGGFFEPAGESTTNCIQVNHVEPNDYYGIARLNAEAKHRAFRDLRIVDLRVFAYFSRFIDLEDGYFITDVLNSVLHKTSLITSDFDFVRDFLHPKDLFTIVQKCITAGTINTAFDVTSAKPVRKSEILDYFANTYGLQYTSEKFSNTTSATGVKDVYYSTYHSAEHIGYKPKFSSLDAIIEESKYILGQETV